MTYRYMTTTGEGTFSATRRYLDRQPPFALGAVIVAIREKTKWLLFPSITEEHVEFYFTEEGRERFESTIKATQEACLGELVLKTVAYDDLSHEIVYEDPYQIAIRARRQESGPHPYQDPARYCF